MYFKECANLAERHPGLASVIQQVDAQFQEMETDGVMRVGDFADILRADRNQVASVFELLAESGLLLAEEMVECPHCTTPVLRSDYQAVLDEDGEYFCTDCQRRLRLVPGVLITTYRRGEIWKETPRSKEISRIPGMSETRPEQSGPRPPLPPRKRALRATAIDLLTRELKSHIRSAKDHAFECQKRTGTPELLPRPKRKDLARRCKLSETRVSNAFRDKAAAMLNILWDVAGDLDKTMKFKG